MAEQNIEGLGLPDHVARSVHRWRTEPRYQVSRAGLEALIARALAGDDDARQELALRERPRAVIDGALVVGERGRERKRVAPVKGRRGSGAVAREVGQLVGGGGGEAPGDAGGGAPRQHAPG